jgi:hypothetical protein
MRFNMLAMGRTARCGKFIFPIVRRYISSNQHVETTRATTRTFPVRFIEDRRKRSQQDDIRLEPYLSKGVYTEAGGIHSVSSLRTIFFLFLILWINLGT